MRPLDIGELTPLHRRVRRRARVASWAAVPLFLLLGVGWFLFRIVNCQSGLVSPFQHRVCEEAYLVPVAAFGLAMVVAAGRALGLGELGGGVVRSARVLGEPIGFGEQEGRARRVIRHVTHGPHGY